MKKIAALSVAALLAVSTGFITAAGTAAGNNTENIKNSAAVQTEPVSAATGEDAEDEETKELAFTASQKTIKAGKSKLFKVNIKGAKWTSSKPRVATVSSEGRVSAIRYGKTKISATVGGQSVTLLVQVSPKKTVGIDPGHQRRGDSATEPVGPGSSTRKAKVAGGTRGSASGKYEYELTLEVANKLKEELKDRGYRVVMTRTKHDVNISNKERAEKLNKDCDAAIRLHADGLSNTSVRGASVLYPGPNNPYVAYLSADSKKLSSDVLDSYISATGLSSRGLSVRDDLTGTNWSTIPVTLIEMGFMTNRSEDLYMADAGNQEKMADGMADGIDKYFGFK